MLRACDTDLPTNLLPLSDAQPRQRDLQLHLAVLQLHLAGPQLRPVAEQLRPGVLRRPRMLSNFHSFPSSWN